MESGTLTNLTALDLSDNAAGNGVSKLADPKTLPRLASANVGRNRVPKNLLMRLRRRPAVGV